MNAYKRRKKSSNKERDQSFDLKDFQSLEEPLEECSDNSANMKQNNKADYISTNLLFK